MTREEMLAELNRQGEEAGAVRDDVLGGWMGWAVIPEHGGALKITWRPDDGSGAREDQVFRLSDPLPPEPVTYDPLSAPEPPEEQPEQPPLAEFDPPPPTR